MPTSLVYRAYCVLGRSCTVSVLLWCIYSQRWIS